MDDLAPARKIRFGIVLAAAYILTGKLGLLLAVDGGYATPMFPPAGIALAGTLLFERWALPWVFLGALVLNLTLGGATGTSVVGITAAVGIACASTLQAWLGSWVIRRYVGMPLVFNNGRVPVRFALAAATVCLSGASLAVVVLMSLKLVATSALIEVWGTWWIGDALGVLLVTPLAMLIVGPQQPGWDVGRRRLLLVLSGGLLVVGLAAHRTTRLDGERALEDFHLLSQHLAGQIASRLSEQETFIDQFAVAMSGRHRINHDDFLRISQAALARFSSSLQAIEWAPLVTDGERDAFEREQRLRHPGFAIRKRAAEAVLVPVERRAAHLPVTYLDPLPGNEAALGFDLLSSPERGAAIETARSRQGPTATAPLKLVQERGVQQGILLMHWVSGGAGGPGLALVVIRMGDFLKAAIGDLDRHLMVRLTDRGTDESAGDAIVFDGFSAAPAKTTEHTILAGGRRYRLETAPTPAYLAAHRSTQGWVVAVAGLGFLSILNLFLLHLFTRAASIEILVAERTREYEESQQEAHRASNLLREAVGSIAQGFTIYDEQDRLVICNEAYRNFYEESRDLIVTGNTFEEIVRRGAERGQYAAAIGDIDGWVRQRVVQHQKADGEVLEQKLGDGRWLLIVEHRTPSGYIVGNRIDITELKRTAEALRQRELYLRATLDNLPFFFWLKDAESRFLAVNKVFSDACGQPGPEAVIGLTDLDVWPRELAERYRADDFEVMASRREKAIEEPVAGGSAVGWIETYKKPVIAADGTLLGTVGFARDISDRRLAEDKAREHAAQLNAIFDLSPDGFVSFDAGRRVKYASPAFFRMTGLAAADIEGLDEEAFAARLTRECLPGTSFPPFAVLRGPNKVGAGDTAAGEARRRLIETTGAGRRVLEVGLRRSLAETVSQILYFRDVTHETEVDRMKSEFLSTAAHELRTPMASIYGFSEVMLAHDFSEDEKRDFLETIHRQSELMVSIINELLDLARIEARRGKDFCFERTNLRDLLRDIVRAFKVPDGRQPPVEPPSNGPCWVRADSKKLTQAISNVLANAYKYSPDGGRVEMMLEKEQGEAGDSSRIGIRIRDQGIGMTPEQQLRVCERFYRADTSGKIPGTGLGMSIVKEIVELHGGRVEIDSKVGAGATVTLWIPAAPAETGPDVSRRSAADTTQRNAP